MVDPFISKVAVSVPGARSCPPAQMNPSAVSCNELPSTLAAILERSSE